MAQVLKMKKGRIYLAGPEVFLTNASEIGEAKKALCEGYGFIGLFPLDAELPQQLDADSSRTPQQLGFAISAGNEALIRQADLVIANLTPFRGPSADVGTAYELGFARGLGKPIHGYSHDQRAYQERVWSVSPAQSPKDQQVDHWRDGQGYKIEEFQLQDNLMLQGGICQAGGIFQSTASTIDPIIADLTAFEKVLQQLAKIN